MLEVVLFKNFTANQFQISTIKLWLQINGIDADKTVLVSQMANKDIT